MQSGVLITYSSESTPGCIDRKSPAQLLPAWPSAMAGPTVKLVVLGERKAGVGSLLLNFVADEEELPRNFSTHRFSSGSWRQCVPALVPILLWLHCVLSCGFRAGRKFPFVLALALSPPNLRTYRKHSRSNTTAVPLRLRHYLLHDSPTSSYLLTHVSLFHSLSPPLSLSC